MVNNMEDFKLPELEVVEVTCNKEDLLDSMWLFNNIPWGNHDGKVGKAILSEPAELFCIETDGYDTKTAKLQSFIFDNVIITAMHGFGGNSYLFNFRLGDVKVGFSIDEETYGYSKEEVKSRFVEQLNRRVKGLKHQLKTAKKSIEIINNL